MTSSIVGRPAGRPTAAPMVLGFLLVLVSLVLGVISAQYGGADGIAAGEHLPPATHFAIFAFGAGATGMLLSHRRSQAACAIGVGTMVTLILLTVLGRALGPSYQEGSYRSPTQRMDLRITTTAAQVRPTQRVRLQEVRGLRSRYWEVGCARGKDTTISDVHWVSPDVVELTVLGRTERLTVGANGPVSIPPSLRRC
ncbi:MULTISPECIES: hypothetical protein [unclassified Luteococcus]|uniref:hypothetical protein n=1 Tax=unclassified Luteococcus TaxID=2639923 RepID=UPI00313DCCC9